MDVYNTDSEAEYVNGFLEEIQNDIPSTFFRFEPDIINEYAINLRRELRTYGIYHVFYAILISRFINFIITATCY